MAEGHSHPHPSTCHHPPPPSFTTGGVNSAVPSLFVTLLKVVSLIHPSREPAFCFINSIIFLKKIDFSCCLHYFLWSSSFGFTLLWARFLWSGSFNHRLETSSVDGGTFLAVLLSILVDSFLSSHNKVCHASYNATRQWLPSTLASKQ